MKEEVVNTKIIYKKSWKLPNHIQKPKEQKDLSWMINEENIKAENIKNERLKNAFLNYISKKD